MNTVTSCFTPSRTKQWRKRQTSLRLSYFCPDQAFYLISNVVAYQFRDWASLK